MSEPQQQYLSQVGNDHRKKYAQYFTPPSIANFMRHWVLAGNPSNELFDPAFGLGAFFVGADANLTGLGMDVDPCVLDFYLAHSQLANVTVCQGNYLLQYGQKHANIICNPPYLKFQQFAQKEAVLSSFQMNYGISLSGYTNIASAFLVKSIFELKDGGKMAYIMPPEFLNAGYGRQVKEVLVQRRHLAHILQLSCEQEAFPDATTSLCILLYDSARTFSELAFHSIDSLEQLDDVLTAPPLRKVSYSQLNPAEKWGKYFKSNEENAHLKHNFLVPLSTYGHFSRGIATGANEFFVLRKSDVSRLSLQEADYAGCITKSAQITHPIFTQSDFEQLANTDAPVFLLNASTVISPAAQEYIRYGEKAGYNQRYITRNRTPWYKMEKRASAPIMLNVFSRNGYKAVRNFSTVQSLTPFHCFYPNLFGTSLLDRLFLYLLSDTGHFILASSVRKYGNNLEKFEPNDLNHSLVPSADFFDQIPQDEVNHLMQKLRVGEEINVEVEQIYKPLIETSA